MGLGLGLGLGLVMVAARQGAGADGADSKTHAIAALLAGGKLDPQSVRSDVPWASAWLGSARTSAGGRAASWYLVGLG